MSTVLSGRDVFVVRIAFVRSLPQEPPTHPSQRYQSRGVKHACLGTAEPTTHLLHDTYPEGTNTPASTQLNPRSPIHPDNKKTRTTITPCPPSSPYQPSSASKSTASHSPATAGTPPSPSTQTTIGLHRLLYDSGVDWRTRFVSQLWLRLAGSSGKSLCRCSTACTIASSREGSALFSTRRGLR